MPTQPPANGRPLDVVVGADGEPGYTSVEICAGAGGQALGLENARFRHLALVEYDKWCCDTLRARRAWRDKVREIDLHEWTAKKFKGKVDLFAGGVPCPPFSRAGRKLGADDERDLFPKAIELIGECKPRAVMLENVRGLLSAEFADYRRDHIEGPLRNMGFEVDWKLLNASDYGVPQLRPRAIFVALTKDAMPQFTWPSPQPHSAPTVGEALRREMASSGWRGANAWAERANSIAPTLVGGSKKHGGPDLGPTQAKKRWLELGVNGLRVADEPPPASWNGEPPMLTVRMAAMLQGFPRDWPFAGRKTNAYRQVGNAFPPPVAQAVGEQIHRALQATDAGLDPSGRQVERQVGQIFDPASVA
jgi:DNA (cytosine-5)-methyltransferase 1